MSFSFDQTLPTERDQFRDRLDDTSEASPYYTDEQIDALITKFGYYGALLLGVNKILLKLGKKVTSMRTAAGAQFAWQERVKVFRELKADIEAEMSLVDYLAEDSDFPGGNVATLPFSDDQIIGYMDIVPYIPDIDGRSIPQIKQIKRC